jgi:hypothetical protein
MISPTTIHGVPLDQSALAPVQAFAKAITDADEESARASCVPGSWEHDGDTPKSLFTQCVRKGLTLNPGIIGKMNGDRASARVFLGREGSEEVVQDLWFALNRESGQWKIAAPTKSRPTVGLFLRGDLALPSAVQTLPPCESVAAWAQAAAENPEGPLAEFAATGESLHVAHATSLAGRGAACFQLTPPAEGPPPTAWVALEQDASQSWQPRRWSRKLSLESLLDGLEIPWDADEHDKEITMSDDTHDNTPTPDAGETPNPSQKTKANVPPEKAAEMIQAFGELIKGMAQAKERGEIETPTIKIKPGEGGKLPEAMLNLFSAAIQQAQTNQGAQSASAAPTEAPAPAAAPAVDNVVDIEQAREKRENREPTELELKVQNTVKTAFTEYMAKNVATDGNPDVNVDGEFLKQHGPAVMGAVMQSLASVLIPDKLEFSVPAETEASEGEEPRKVNLKIDLAGMLSSLKPKGTPSKNGD